MYLEPCRRTPSTPSNSPHLDHHPEVPSPKGSAPYCPLPTVSTQTHTAALQTAGCSFDAQECGKGRTLPWRAKSGPSALQQLGGLSGNHSAGRLQPAEVGPLWRRLRVYFACTHWTSTTAENTKRTKHVQLMLCKRCQCQVKDVSVC